jgi:hypothetical protein
MRQNLNNVLGRGVIGAGAGAADAFGIPLRYTLPAGLTALSAPVAKGVGNVAATFAKSAAPVFRKAGGAFGGGLTSKEAGPPWAGAFGGSDSSSQEDPIFKAYESTKGTSDGNQEDQ